MRLWILLTLVVDGLILLGSALYGSYIGGTTVQRLMQDLRSDSHNLARSIAVATADDLLLGNYDRIENQLMRLVPIGAVRDLEVFDSAGRRLVRVTRKTSDDLPLIDYTVPTQNIDLSRREILEPDRFTLLEPIGKASSPLGWVQVSSSLSGLAEVRQSIWNSTLIAALITALVISVLLALLIRQITASLGTAAAFASDLVGHRSVFLTMGSRIFEIDQLQRALNGAAQTLATQFQALQDSEGRKRAMLEANLDCLVTMDQDGRIVDFNPAAETVFGWQRDEVMGARLSDIMIPITYRAAHEAGMRYYLATGEGPVLRKRIEITGLRRDGSEFPVELTVVPFEGSGKQFFLGSLRDISARKLLESERERVTAQLQQAIKDMTSIQFALDQHAIVSKTNVQGNITYVNDKFLQISGYSREELLGRNHRLLKSGQHDDSFYENMWATLAAGEVWHGEIANLRADGETYWVASTIVPMPGEDGLAHQYISVRTDITDQKRTAHNLELTGRNLEELVEKYRKAQLEIEAVRSRELAIGSQIQRTLLFGNLPARFGPLAVAAYSEASKGIDGDFYEFFSYGAEHCDLSIGDVMGKGIPAALIGAAVKRQLSQVMLEELGHSIDNAGVPEPDRLINALHSHVTQQLFNLESFVTLSYLRIDVARNLATLVSAGHPPVLLVGEHGIRWLSGDNLPLGVMANERYVQRQFKIEAGELLFMYSDGFTEAFSPDGEEYGAERLSQRVSELQTANVPVATLVQAVRWSIHNFEHREVPSDDRTCIAIRCNASDTETPIEIELPWKLDALAAMRQLIEERAGLVGLSEEACGALVLAAYEASTNVIRHATPSLCDANLLVRVADTASGLEVSLYYIGTPYVPVAREPDFSGESEGGFGLYIIENCVDVVLYDSPAESVVRVYMCKNKPEPASDISDS